MNMSACAPINRNMAPIAPNVAGIAASDAETKNEMEMAPIKHAAPTPEADDAKTNF